MSGSAPLMQCQDCEQFASKLDAYNSRGKQVPLEPQMSYGPASMSLVVVSAQGFKLDESGCSACAQLEHARRACRAGFAQLAPACGVVCAGAAGGRGGRAAAGAHPCLHGALVSASWWAVSMRVRARFRAGARAYHSKRVRACAPEWERARSRRPGRPGRRSARRRRPVAPGRRSARRRGLVFRPGGATVGTLCAGGAGGGTSRLLAASRL